MAGLEGQWLEVFRTGDYGEKGNWSTDDLQRIAASYDPKIHEAPVVVGHPEHDQPAYGWIKDLRVRQNGAAILEAQLHQVEPQFEQLVREGRFKHRSVALYKNFERTGGVYLRHLGFLGAQAPKVKGLRAPKFQSGDAEHIEFAVNLEEKLMEDNKDPKNPHTLSQEEVGRLKQFAERVKSFFGGGNGEPTKGAGLDQALAKQRQELEASFNERFKTLQEEMAAAKKETDEKVSEFAQGKRRQQIDAFVEKLTTQGKWVPAFEKTWNLQTLMHKLAGSDVELTFTEKQDGKDVEVKRSAVEVLQRFLADQGKVVDFSHIAGKARSAAARRGRLVPFTEKRSGPSPVDADSIELAEKAEAQALELRKADPKLSESAAYKQALQLLRNDYTPA